MRKSERIGDLLNETYQKYHRSRFLRFDPLEFVHGYSDPWDQEAVALLSALLAWGRVDLIRRSVGEVLARISQRGQGPAGFVRNRPDPEAFRGFVHRLNRGEHLVVLLALLARSWERHGSLGGHLLSKLGSEDQNFGMALDALLSEWKTWSREFGMGEDRAFLHLLSAPSGKSACKRWCMLLRWMGRRDALDPGLWTRESPMAASFPEGRFLRPDQLVIPLDTHTGRISRDWGLTSRAQTDWRAALEVTQALKRFDPQDPVKYDFALVRLGMDQGGALRGN